MGGWTYPFAVRGILRDGVGKRTEILERFGESTLGVERGLGHGASAELRRHALGERDPAGARGTEKAVSIHASLHRAGGILVPLWRDTVLMDILPVIDPVFVQLGEGGCRSGDWRRGVGGWEGGLGGLGGGCRPPCALLACPGRGPQPRGGPVGPGLGRGGGGGLLLATDAGGGRGGVRGEEEEEEEEEGGGGDHP